MILHVYGLTKPQLVELDERAKAEGETRDQFILNAIIAALGKTKSDKKKG